MIDRDPRSRLGQDHHSGASELVGLAALAAKAALEERGPATESLIPALRRICRAQPAMGSVLRLASRILEVATSAEHAGTDPDRAVSEIQLAIGAFLADFDVATEAIVERGAELVPSSGWVATYSRSSLVERVLLATAARRRPLFVLLTESRPQLEGRELARKLAGAGVPCWLTVDAAGGLLLPQARAMLLGADAVLPKTFVNKAGTYALLLAARELNVPAYALAQRAKFVSSGAKLLELGERDPSPVWEEAPAGVSVRNLAFEESPLSLLRGVVVEDGVLPPGEAGIVASQASVHEALSKPWGSLPGESIG